MTPGSVGAYAALLRYMLITAIRERLFLALPGLLTACAALALFTGGAAITEQREMAAAFFGAGSRIILIFGLIIFVCFHVRRAMTGGETAFILSRPLSRAAFVLVYTASLGVIAVMCAGLTATLAFLSVRPPLTGLALWSASLLLEAMLMIQAALFFALSLNSAVAAVLASAGFYALSRLSGLLGDLAQSAQNQSWGDWVLAKGFTVISVILPRLDLFARGEFLVYGWRDGEPGIYLAVLQSLVFMPLILSAAMIDFSRRRL